LTDAFKPFDFSNIVGQPHDMPSSLDKFPTFHGDNSICAKEHWDVFIEHIITLGVCHLDILYKQKSLSLKIDARKWFLSFPNHSINYFQACQNVFFDRWLENKDNKFLLNSLTNIKLNENETIDEFNHMFEKIV
jgi:hypothetical protein